MYDLIIFVGIDIAISHFASAISSDGKVLIEPFEISNNTDGFRLLLSRLRSLESDNIICGLESTAHYGNNLVRYPVDNSFKVCYQSYQNFILT